MIDGREEGNLALPAISLARSGPQVSSGAVQAFGKRFIAALWTRALIFMLWTALAQAPSVSIAEEAQSVGPVTNLPLPRFVSLRSAEINVRRGPGLSYPKDWVFRRAGLPVRVIAEHGDWRRVLDSDDAGGWVYHALLTGRRTVLVTAAKILIRAEPAPEAEATAELHQGVIARLVSCEAMWCLVRVEDVEGWVPVSAIWGVGPKDLGDE